MGDDLGTLYYHLWQEVALLNVRWNNFRDLFTAPKNIDVMNRTARRFFARLQQTLMSEVMLHLCRLTDPPRSSGRANLTLQALPELLLPEDLRTGLLPLIDQVVADTEFARIWRNRRLAHNDLERVLNPELDPLPTASRTHIDQAIVSVGRVVNLVESGCLGAPTRFEDTLAAGQGPRALIWYLKLGLEAEKARHDRMQGRHPESS
jgi:hypothetical protein